MTPLSAPIVIAGEHTCIPCGGVLSRAAIGEGNYIGSESAGRMCCECALKQLEALELFGKSLNTFYANNATKDYPCARCGRALTEGYLVEIDGRFGELCVQCTQWFSVHGGTAKGTEAEWILKLK